MTNKIPEAYGKLVADYEDHVGFAAHAHVAASLHLSHNGVLKRLGVVREGFRAHAPEQRIPIEF